MTRPTRPLVVAQTAGRPACADDALDGRSRRRIGVDVVRVTLASGGRVRVEWSRIAGQAAPGRVFAPIRSGDLPLGSISICLERDSAPMLEMPIGSLGSVDRPAVVMVADAMPGPCRAPATPDAVFFPNDAEALALP
jgi:hypothetical protein